MKSASTLALAALAAGCSPLDGGFETPLGQTAPGQLVGRLTYPDGGWASGVDVVLRQSGTRQSARTGADGRFLFEAPPLGAVELAGHDHAGRGFFHALVLEAAGLNDTSDLTLTPVGDIMALSTFPGLGLEERVTSLNGRCDHPRRTEDGRAIICLRTVGDDRSRVVSSIDVESGAETVVAEIPEVLEQGPCEARVDRVQGRIVSLMAPNGALLVDLARPGSDAIVAVARDDDDQLFNQLCELIPFDVAGAELRHLRWKVGEPWAQIRDSFGVPYPRVMYQVEVVRQDLDAAAEAREVERTLPFPAEMGAWTTVRSAPGGFAVAMVVAAWCPRRDCGPLFHHEAELAPYDAQMLVVRAGDAAPYRLAREPGNEIYMDEWVLTPDGREVWTIEGGTLRVTDVTSGERTSTSLPVPDPHAVYTLYPTSDGEHFFASGVAYVDGGSMVSVLRLSRRTGQAHAFPLIGTGASTTAQPLPTGGQRLSFVLLDEADRLIVIQELGARGDLTRPPPAVTRLTLDGGLQHETYPGPIDVTRGPATLTGRVGGAREALVEHDPVTGRLQVFEGPRGGALRQLAQRTFLNGSHQAPFYAGDDRTLYFWAEDPETNYPQLFRLDVSAAP